MPELREAGDFRAFVKAVSAYLREGYELPDDEELLGRMLEHPRESIVVDVLNHLSDLDRRRTLKGSASLKARLKSVKTVSDDPRMHELARSESGPRQALDAEMTVMSGESSREMSGRNDAIE